MARQGSKRTTALNPLPRRDPALAQRAIDELIAYASNPRTHSPEQIAQIAASIREFGWTNPVLVDEKGTIIAGHGRVQAARQLGLASVPCITLDHLSEAQKRALVIADNKLALNAGWDSELLRIELLALQDMDFNLPLIGFDPDELADLLTPRTEGLTDPDAIPDTPDEPISKPGDLWELGRHRLLCGDSTKVDDVRRLMDGKRAALFATDPPYAIDYQGGSHPVTKANRGKANRDKNWSQIYREADPVGLGQPFYEAFIDVAIKEAIDPHAAWYCWHASARASMVERAWEAHGAFVHQQIIWAKTRPVLTFSMLMWGHEPCWMGWLKGHKPPGGLNQAPPDFKSTVWSVPSAEVESTDHPTCKPTKLFIAPMMTHTKTGGLCYEPFSGSGSQIIAAEQTGRSCYAMEISPIFVDVAVERWQNFTGQKATRVGVNNGQRQRAPKTVPSHADR